MVEYEKFIDVVKEATGRDVFSNPEQQRIISASKDKSIKVVAGPGSGKTTVIVLRLMKLIFVDGIAPQRIIATTFTVKASKELKSRILSWGMKIRDGIIPKLSPLMDAEERSRIQKLNFDAIIVGTLDSISKDILTDECRADQDPPIVIEEFISKHFLVLKWFEHKELWSGAIEELKSMGFSKYFIGSPAKPKVSGALKYLMDFHNRMVENGIASEDLQTDYPNIAAILTDYDSDMFERRLMDFSMLEQRFLSFVSSSESDKYFENTKVIMVDEYQDTNLLQERIYGEIAKRVTSNGGCFIAVGDDDQSIYRFRGSRVHLFADIDERFKKKYDVLMDTEFLCVNYRSTKNIVDFCNDFVTIDDSYQDVRVRDKPDMSVSRTNCDNFPIFGIFRNDLNDLADDITNLVYQYAVNGSYKFIDVDGNEYLFEKGESGGAGDIVLLMSSTSDLNSTGNKSRLPAFIKSKMNEKNPAIPLFNPRGSRLCDDGDVVLLMGTLLWCIDGEYAIANQLHLDDRARATLDRWRDASRLYIQNAQFDGISLSEIVRSWSTGTPYPPGGKWTKKEVTVLDILYNLLPWFEKCRDDAEVMVSVQAVFNAIYSASIVKGDELTIRFDNDHNIVKASVKELYKFVVRPLLEDTLDVDESLFFSLSTENRFNVMTIHQSKGLEFPITIVDVCSDFERNSAPQRIMRFPEKEDETSIIERVLSKYNPDIRTDRDGIDMQFDDLIRKYFVSFSRAQDVLILVGLTKSLSKLKSGEYMKNVALGWSRDEEWKWKGMNNIIMKRV